MRSGRFRRAMRRAQPGRDPSRRSVQRAASVRAASHLPALGLPVTRLLPGSLLLPGLLLLVGCAGAGGVGVPGVPSSERAGAGTSLEGVGADGFERDVYAFEVLDEFGEPYEHPFLGGLTVPRPQFVDIDGDGDPDLFVQERSGELMYFENVGGAGEPRFRWRSDFYGGLEVGEWFVFHDLTGDGQYELLSELRFDYMRVYRNEGTLDDPRFVVALDSIRDVEGRAIFSDRQNIPHLVDLDCSGSLDLLLGRIDGMITHYREEERVDGFPRFRRVTDRFENIEIIGQIGSMHGANAMSFIDMTGNGALDLLWGDFFEPSVLLIRNRVPCPGYDLDSPPEPLQTPEGNLLTSGHNVPVPADLRGDGRMDLIVGVLGGAFNPVLTASNNLQHYTRGDDGLFRLVTERFLAGIDVGSESIVEVADVTGNGRPDLVIGNKIDPVETRTGRLYLFENREGPEGEPQFALADTLSLEGIFHYAPAMGDLFGSGRPDLLLGSWNDGVLVYRNLGREGEGGAGSGSGGALDAGVGGGTGSASGSGSGGAAGAEFPRFERVPGLTLELTRGSHAVPALGDLTGNGLLDVVVGRSSGQLTWFRNVGSATEPAFERVTDELGDIDVGRRSAPYLADLNGNGLLDLIVGREEGGAVLYWNVGTREEPAFELDETFEVPLFALGRPVPVDFAGEGRTDLVSGANTGGVVYLRGPSR